MRKEIFLSLKNKFIIELLRRKRSAFPPEWGQVSRVKIKKVSPFWAKDTCLARYEVVFENGKKIFLRGTADVQRAKKRVFEIMKLVWNSGFNEGTYQIAKPIAYEPKINLLIYEEAPGQPLESLLRKEKSQSAEIYVSHAASWLAKLHKLKIAKKCKRAPYLGAKGYASIIGKAKKSFPELRSFVIPFEKIVAIDKVWGENQTIIHNDFYPGNFIVGKDRYCGIDFDRAGCGPYLMDLASFCYALRFPQEIWPSGIEISQAQKYQDVFLKKYCRDRSLSVARVKKKLELFYLKIVLDQINFFTSFTLKGLGEMKGAEKKKLVHKIKLLMLEASKLI